MEQLIQLLVLVVIFGVVVWGAFCICDRSAASQPVRWIVGAILLIALLYFMAGQFGGGLHQFRWR